MNVAVAATAKVCRKCGIQKPTTEFGVRRDRPDGIAIWCRECAREAAAVVNLKRRDKLAAYREANREKINARMAAYRETNRDVINEKQRDRNRRNAEEGRVRQRAYNPATRKARRDADVHAARVRERAARQRRIEQTRAYARRWYAENREKFNEWNQRRRARIKGAPVVERINRAKIIERDASICHICGLFVSSGEMSLDHVVALANGGSHTEGNLRVAHLICNIRKGAR